MTAPVTTLEEMVSDEQLLARDLIDAPDNGDLPSRIGCPAQPTAEPDASLNTVPYRGEHSAEILDEAGFSEDRITTLRESGAIK